MAKRFTPKVLTANHLLDGDVIYWDKSGKWARAFEDALYLDSESVAQTALHAAEQQPDVAVDPYLTDARLNAAGHPIPAHFREDFRNFGPSNYPHGKQAEA